MRPAVRAAQLGNAERAGRDAIATTITDVILDNHGAEFGADDGPGRTCVQATGMHAMLADIAQHQPGDAVPRWSFDERYVTPRGGSEVDGIVITESGHREGRRGSISRQLIPLLAGNLARFATDTDGRIGEKPNRGGSSEHR